MISQCHKEAAVDGSILSRVSEAEVTSWLVARLISLRSSGMPCGSLSVNVSFYETSKDFNSFVTLYGAGSVAMSADLDKALATLEIKWQGEYGKIEDKRRDAQDLLREAGQLEAYLAMKAGKETASHG